MFSFVRSFIGSLYIGKVFFLVLSGAVVLYILAYFFPVLWVVPRIVTIMLIVLSIIDCVILYKESHGINVVRPLTERLSNGDYNSISLIVTNNYRFNTVLKIVEEVPIQFQARDIEFILAVPAGDVRTITYTIRPTQRGEYSFGVTNVYCETFLHLLQRRYRIGTEQRVKVYPSYIQMKTYELMAISHRLVEIGVKKIRRVGHAREFDQIRDYTQGDEYRTINWNATARRSTLMVNQYQDEKSQNVYSVIDMGRTMRMPFEGMTLLDYAINSSLVISNIAMLKDDKAGLITFSNQIDTCLLARRSKGQLRTIMDSLYKQETRFGEANYEMAYSTLRSSIHHRSLLLYFTNFETLHSLKRQLPYFIRLAKNHLLCVIFFENTEMKQILDSTPEDLEQMYIHAIGEKFTLEKRLMVRELEKYGIHAILTTPKNLTVNTINKYLEFKSRNML